MIAICSDCIRNFIKRDVTKSNINDTGVGRAISSRTMATPENLLANLDGPDLFNTPESEFSRGFSTLGAFR